MNYWVDVIFVPAATTATYSIAGTITGPGAAGAAVTLSGAASASTTADSNGAYSFAGLANGNYIVTPSGTARIFLPAGLSLTIQGAAITGADFQIPSNCPCNTLWQPSAVPAVIDSRDGHTSEQGVRFRADSDGYITGIRFYKAAGNTGTHIGNLWSNSGTLLAGATFTAETTSGWQQVLFATPVAISAGSTYVASYIAPAGHYSISAGDFSSAGLDTPPLHALANGVDGQNGVAAYSSTPVFPVYGTPGMNYWVDVIFVPAATTATYSIAGTITGPGAAGATVTLSGASSASTTADSNGAYSFAGLANGNYIVTPVGNGTYLPARRPLSRHPGCSHHRRRLPDTLQLSMQHPVAALRRTCRHRLQGRTHLGAGGQVPRRLRWVHHRNTLLQGRRKHRNPHRKSLVQLRHAAGGRYLHRRDHIGMAAGSLRYSRRHLRRIHLRRFLHRSRRTLLHLCRRLLQRRPRHSATACPRKRRRRSERSSCLLQHARLPRLRHPRHELLGRCHLRPRRHHCHLLHRRHHHRARSGWSQPSPSVEPHPPPPPPTATALIPSRVWPTETTSSHPRERHVSSCPPASLSPSRVQPSPAPTSRYPPTVHATPCGSPPPSPAVIDSRDGHTSEQGVRFRADSDGYITGIRFYKAAGNTGTHIGNLWSNSGTLLAGATFTAETTSGWQQVLFATPVAISAGIHLRRFLHRSRRTLLHLCRRLLQRRPRHSATACPGERRRRSERSSCLLQHSRLPRLRHPRHELLGRCHLRPRRHHCHLLHRRHHHRARSGGSQPSHSAEPHPPPPPPTATAPTPSQDWPTETTSSRPREPARIFLPASLSLTIQGARHHWRRLPDTRPTVHATPCGSPPPYLPSSTARDGHTSEQGVRFRADSDGYITGIRFYKAAGNTGTHIGNLWSNSGTLLAGATFTAETASGWQQVLFATPVAISAGSTYVASYIAPAGHYSISAGDFSSAGLDTPPLHALANGVDGQNGVAAYSSTPVFPVYGTPGMNYWVDVIFVPAATTATYSIAGTITGPGAAGASVTLSGAASASTTADSNGAYSFAGLANGNYIVTPRANGFAYNPTSASATINNAHVLGLNFNSN